MTMAAALTAPGEDRANQEEASWERRSVYRPRPCQRQSASHFPRGQAMRTRKRETAALAKRTGLQGGEVLDQGWHPGTAVTVQRRSVSHHISPWHTGNTMAKS